MQQHQKELSVVTFNISGLPYPPYLKQRMAAIAEYFNESDVDVLMFQEVHTYGTLRYLKNHLTHFPHGTYVRSLRGPKAGLVIFSRFPVRGVRFVGVTRGTQKGMLITQLGDITLVNVHLSANKDGDWRPGNRYHLKQSIQLNDVARQMHQLKGKLVIGGDFNLARHADLYDLFLDRTYLEDTAGSDNTPSFHMSFLPPDRTPVCIDFIFTREARTTGYTHHFSQPVNLAPGIDDYVSSHHAINAELSFDN